MVTATCEREAMKAFSESRGLSGLCVPLYARDLPSLTYSPRVRHSVTLGQHARCTARLEDYTEYFSRKWRGFTIGHVQKKSKLRRPHSSPHPQGRLRSSQTWYAGAVVFGDVKSSICIPDGAACTSQPHFTIAKSLTSPRLHTQSALAPCRELSCTYLSR